MGAVGLTGAYQGERLSRSHHVRLDFAALDCVVVPDPVAFGLAPRRNLYMDGLTILRSLEAR